MKSKTKKCDGGVTAEKKRNVTNSGQISRREKKSVTVVTVVTADTKEASEENSIIKNPKPYSKPVRLSTVLDDALKLSKTHIILPDQVAFTICLYVAMTYVYKTFFKIPLLAALSPVKRCGKTDLLSLLVWLCFKCLGVSDITPAALRRAVQKYGCTLAIDELDAYGFNKKTDASEALRKILNAGHNKAMSSSLLCDDGGGAGYDVKALNAFAPKIVAAIGALPETIMDRSIVVWMHRKSRTESRELISEDTERRCLHIKRKFVRWAKDNERKIKSTKSSRADAIGRQAAG